MTLSGEVRMLLKPRESKDFAKFLLLIMLMRSLVSKWGDMKRACVHEKERNSGAVLAKEAESVQESNLSYSTESSIKF